MVLFLALAAASVPFATNTYWAFETTQAMTLYIFATIVPMCILIISMDRLKKLLYFWIGTHVYIALYAITHGGTGPGSFIADENDVALALNVALPFAYFFWQGNVVKGVGKWILGACFVVMVAGVVATASRGGFVGLSVLAVAIIWFSKKRFRNAILVTLAAAVFYFSIPDSYKVEILSIEDTKDNTRLERIYSWKRGWEMFVDNPVFGVGVGNYPWRVAEYEIKSGSNYGQRRMLGGRAAHSLYFTLLPETGIAGTLTVVMLIFHFFMRLKTTDERNRSSLYKDSYMIDVAVRAAKVSMIAFLVTAVFISVLYYPQMWYLFGFAFVIDFVCRNEVSRQKVFGDKDVNDILVCASAIVK